MPYCKNNDSKFKWDGLNPNEKLAEPDQEPTNKQRKKTNKEQKKQYKNRHLNPNLKYPYGKNVHLPSLKLKPISYKKVFRYLLLHGTIQ